MPILQRRHAMFGKASSVAILPSTITVVVAGCLRICISAAIASAIRSGLCVNHGFSQAPKSGFSTEAKRQGMRNAQLPELEITEGSFHTS